MNAESFINHIDEIFEEHLYQILLCRLPKDPDIIQGCITCSEVERIAEYMLIRITTLGHLRWLQNSSDLDSEPFKIELNSKYGHQFAKAEFIEIFNDPKLNDSEVDRNIVETIYNLIEKKYPDLVKLSESVYTLQVLGYTEADLKKYWENFDTQHG
jgi:hypothetical protein